MTRLFIDMDGVIADFDGHYEQSFGEHPSYPRKHTKKELWAFIKNHPGDFFAEIPPMDGLDDLFATASPMFRNGDLESIQLLTSVGNSLSGAVKAGKEKWLTKRGISLQALYTRNGEDKAWFAKPGDILIDDMEKNIAAWKAAGGRGILFKNTDQAIDDLLEAVYANPSRR